MVQAEKRGFKLEKADDVVTEESDIDCEVIKKGIEVIMEDIRQNIKKAQAVRKKVNRSLHSTDRKEFGKVLWNINVGTDRLNRVWTGLVKHMSSEEDEWRDIVNEERGKLRDLEKRHQELKEVVGRIRKERNSAEEREKGEKEKVTEARGEIDSFRELLKQREKEKEEMKEKIKNMQTEMKGTQKEVENIKMEVLEMRKIAPMKEARQGKEIQEENNNIWKEISTMRKEIGELRDIMEKNKREKRENEGRRKIRNRGTKEGEYYVEEGEAAKEQDEEWIGKGGKKTEGREGIGVREEIKKEGGGLRDLLLDR